MEIAYFMEVIDKVIDNTSIIRAAYSDLFCAFPTSLKSEKNIMSYASAIKIVISN
jgi:hypothetical protein